MTEKSCGFAIATYDQRMIEENAAERAREGESFGRFLSKKGKISDAGWDQLNKDVSQLERNSLAWLKKTFGSARDDGHDSYNDLVGSVWYDPENKHQMELLELASDKGRSERIDMHDASYGDLSRTVWVGVSDFGAAVLDGAITFFDVDEEF